MKDIRENNNIGQLIIEDYFQESKTYNNVSNDKIDIISNYLTYLFEKNDT